MINMDIFKIWLFVTSYLNKRFRHWQVEYLAIAPRIDKATKGRLESEGAGGSWNGYLSI